VKVSQDTVCSAPLNEKHRLYGKLFVMFIGRTP